MLVSLARNSKLSTRLTSPCVTRLSEVALVLPVESLHPCLYTRQTTHSSTIVVAFRSN